MSERASPAAPWTMQSAMQGPDRPPTAVAALARRAAETPEEPALFHPDGLDVRWRSWRVLADQVARGAARLREAGWAGPGGVPRIALSWRTHPDAVATWLAIRGAGALPVATASDGEAAAAGCVGRLLQPDETPPPVEREATGLDEAIPTVRLPGAEPAWGRGGRTGEGGRSERAAAGGPAIDPAAAPGVPDAGPLADRIARSLAGADAAGGSRADGEREIVLTHLDLARPGDEALLAWALVSGAALLLEPDVRSLPASAAWARPTVVAAGAHPLVDLARRLRGSEEQPSLWRRWIRGLLGPGGRARRPFGRLRLLVVLGEGRLPVDDVPFWADRGVAVLRALGD